jgi:hypothetical protein
MQRVRHARAAQDRCPDSGADDRGAGEDRGDGSANKYAFDQELKESRDRLIREVSLSRPARKSATRARTPSRAILICRSHCALPSSYFTLVANFEVAMDGFAAVKNCLYRMSPSKKTFIHDNPYRPTMPA